MGMVPKCYDLKEWCQNAKLASLFDYSGLGSRLVALIVSECHLQPRFGSVYGENYLCPTYKIYFL